MLLLECFTNRVMARRSHSSSYTANVDPCQNGVNNYNHVTRQILVKTCQMSCRAILSV